MSQFKIFLLVVVLSVTATASVQAQDEGAAGNETAAAEPAVETAETPQSTSVSYQIDATHSTLGFAVKHLGVGTTRGGFNTYEGSITFDPNDFSTFEAIVTLDANTIDTKNEGRDKHLRGPDFFDTEKFPEIKFYSTRLEKTADGSTVIIGDLTMKDVTKEITIPVEISGPVASPFGSTVIGINGQLQVNRQDYGISFSKAMDNGGLIVGDMVNIVIEIEAHHKG